MSAAAFFSKCIILRLKRAEAGTTEGSAASVKLSDGKVSLTCGVPVWRGMACSNGVASGRVCVCACVCVLAAHFHMHVASLVCAERLWNAATQSSSLPAVGYVSVFPTGLLPARYVSS